MKTRIVSLILAGLVSTLLPACVVPGDSREETESEETVAQTEQAWELCSPVWNTAEECITYVESGCWVCQECHTGCMTWGCPDTPIFQNCPW